MDKLDQQFENLLVNIKKYITLEEDINNIAKAYYFAKIKHEGTFRIGGDPYTQHLLDTAVILCDLNAGPNTIAAGLLHDTVEDVEDVSNELIEVLFGKDISTLVDSVTKVNMAEDGDSDKKNLTIQKIFNAMGKDVRTIIIKIADRLSNMRTLDCVSLNQQQRVSKQTLEIYAPVARCIGLNKIAKEMEELCLYYLHNDKFNIIKEHLLKNEEDNLEMLINIENNVKKALLELKINSSAYRTTKDMYSIFKFINNGNSLEEIEDLNVIHIIVEDAMQCYLALGVIHAIYRPMFGKMKDYITSPKYNMYQALHTLIITPDGKSIKLAIKTKLMDNLYNIGVASRWAYSENKGYDKYNEQEEIRKHLNIIRELDRINAEDGVSTNEYVSLLKEDVFNNNQYIYVYTPKGEVIILPIGSTVLDFAFKIHSEIGEKLVSANINGVNTNIYSVLKNGSIISLKTSSVSQVKEEWLEHVKTNYAKIRIKKKIIKVGEDKYE